MTLKILISLKIMTYFVIASKYDLADYTKTTKLYHLRVGIVGCRPWLSACLILTILESELSSVGWSYKYVNIWTYYLRV